MLAALSVGTMVQPNPPVWPDSVKVFRPDQARDEILASIKETEDPYNDEHGCYTTETHFSSNRWALLFAPGDYEGIDFEVGYYVQVAGLGMSPDDVRFRNCEKGPFVDALDKHVHPPHGLSLDTFWRSAENFATQPERGMKWAVSQAAPMRRVHVQGDLYLHDSDAYASGGHLADAKIDGKTRFGGQQQYLCRNVHFGGEVTGGAWSLVFTGCTGNVPAGRKGAKGKTSVTVTKPRIRIEKPFIALQDDGVRFSLCIPTATTESSQAEGPSMVNNNDGILVRDFSKVCVVDASDEDVDKEIELALDAGLDVVFSPGVYRLKRTIRVVHSNTVLLGLGLATLVNPSSGDPCIHVAPRLEGVRIGGIMLEVSPRPKSNPDESSAWKDAALLEWGDRGVEDPGNPENPGAMFDIFCRVGGASGDREAVSIYSMMKLHSGNIIGDNLWLWRADHSELADGEHANYPHISPVFWQNEETEGQVQTGLQVDGDDVTVYGLAVEHANGHQTIWNGDRGAVHFYQCELPYDVDPKFGKLDYRGYLISERVEQHELYAPGVYSNFRNHRVDVTTAIEHPHKPDVTIVNPFTVHLNNNGTILSIVNKHGDPATKQGEVNRLV